MKDAPSWHRLQTEEVVQLLDVDLKTGLQGTDVKLRQEKYGANKLSAEHRRTALKRFLLQLAQPLMYILLIAGAVTLFIGEYIDALVIFGVVAINAIIGYLQESKAEKAIEALLQIIRTEATVRRDARKQRIDAEGLVPGDIVLLQSGDKVPADLRLFHVNDLQVDESALTGESIPVEKHSDALALDTLLADRKNLAFAGTLVTYGQAEGIVWAIGNQTETGRIARLIQEAAELSTPLTRKIEHFSKVLLWVILGLAALTFGLGIARGGGLVEMFMAAVALAVGAIPEGLPAALTISLAIGVVRMAKKGAIIRKLPAVETLGSTTVICSDKTGTLTENQMTVREIFASEKFYEVTGNGYDPLGEILLAGRPIGDVASPTTSIGSGATIPLSIREEMHTTEEQNPVPSFANHVALYETLLAGFLNNDSQIVRKGNRFKVEGDPTEGALIVAAQKGGLGCAKTHEAHPRIDVIPFESEHQFMATLHSRGSGKERVIYKKGSVERLLERSSHALRDDGVLVPLNPASIRTAVEKMAKKGLRVLAFARREVPPDHHHLSHEHVKEGLTFLGLQGMMDPPRPEALTAVHICQEAGIQVKMITGDHLLTARTIAQQLGLNGNSGKELIAITGHELEQVPEGDLPEVSIRAAVFARMAPEQKLKLVRALQSRNHIVAMTGDGVNDAPALKQADIGIAMGIAGSDVAKGAADILLTDDNFASIEAAVEEGRNVFNNLTKFIIWTLPTNIGEAAILLTAILIGTALPVLPVQLLWVNMMTSILLGLMLIFEPKEHDLMRRPPRDPQKPIMTFPLIMRTGLVTVLILAGAFGAFLWEQQVRGKSVVEARTCVINVIVMVEMFYLLNCRSLLHSMFAVGAFSNGWIFIGIAGMLVAQLLFTHAPLMNHLFHTAPLDFGSWLYIISVGLAVWCLVELEKWLRVHSGEEATIII
jgi:cation-transporting ATPase F